MLTEILCIQFTEVNEKTLVDKVKNITCVWDKSLIVMFLQ